MSCGIASGLREPFKAPSVILSGSPKDPLIFRVGICVVDLFGQAGAGFRINSTSQSKASEHCWKQVWLVLDIYIHIYTQESKGRIVQVNERWEITRQKCIREGKIEGPTQGMKTPTIRCVNVTRIRIGRELSLIGQKFQ